VQTNVTQSDSIWLKAGKHPMTVRYFETTGMEWLSLKYTALTQHDLTTFQTPKFIPHNQLFRWMPTLTIAATDATACESGSDSNAVFTISRTGTGLVPVNASYAISGMASNGVDYAAISSPVVLPPGSNSVAVIITPVLDALVEGSETVTLTLLTNTNYVIGASSNATITITDPVGIEQWRGDKFGADAGNPDIAGDLADPDHDSIGNLLEYALGLEPLAAGTTGLPVSGCDGDHLTLTYTRRKAPTDVSYTVEVTGAVTGGWTNTGVTEQVLADDGIFQTVKATDPATISGNPGRFIRLKITRQL